MTDLIHFQQTIFLQDRSILENQIPRLLPLDPGMEIPTQRRPDFGRLPTLAETPQLYLRRTAGGAMKLYDYILSPSCYKVRLMAALTGVKLDIRPVDFHPGAEHRGLELLALNPRRLDPDL